jgi:hypothetical protein
MPLLEQHRHYRGLRRAEYAQYAPSTNAPKAAIGSASTRNTAPVPIDTHATNEDLLRITSARRIMTPPLNWRGAGITLLATKVMVTAIVSAGWQGLSGGPLRAVDLMPEQRDQDDDRNRHAQQIKKNGTHD